MSSVNLALVRAYLTNAQLALHNVDVSSASSFVEHTLALLTPPRVAPPSAPSTHIAVGVGLDAGIKRQGKPNEDSVFATTGRLARTQQPYGLFVVADGMGGHARGREASQLAIETLVDALLPQVQGGHIHAKDAGDALVDGIHKANHAIYQRNRQAGSQTLDQMGTTLTAALSVEDEVSIANVGDSRTYLYHQDGGLRLVTRDHSIVAHLVATGAITREEAYTHEKRNQITRCLGSTPHVAVDLFSERLHDGDILLLCSDGLWEMTRDRHIEQILATSWLSADNMAERLLFLARQGGGLDNIGLIVSQYRIDVTVMQTMVSPLPVSAVAVP